MNGFKEFQGRDLDSAINDACDYFNLVREKLEIEILQDSKSGIFGIVGARKAKIRARRVKLSETLKNTLGKGAKGTVKPAPAPQAEVGDIPANVPTGETAAKAGHRAEPPSGKNRRNAGKGGQGLKKGALPQRDAKDSPHGTGEPIENILGGGGHEAFENDMDDASLDMPQMPLEELDVERLKALIAEIAEKIIFGIVGENTVAIAEICRDRVRVRVDCPQDSGLLIGREGQTLGAVQYLLSRMVSRSMGAAVRIQLDAGDYRRKQEDKLRSLALALADKARRSGRTLSTRPLSSYHRRIVHLSLQNVADIQTRSIGEGPMKRVAIQHHNKVED